MEQGVEVVRRVRTRAFLAVAICCCWRVMTVGYVGGAPPHERFQRENGERQPPSWRLLTRENFTSELKRHEFALCIATLPWSGESRSLMKEILRVVKEDPHSFPGLQLFFVHINKDKLLGKVILGGSITPSFTLFRYGTAYKYSGRRSTSSIMASIRQGITVLRSDSVLLHIDSSLQLESFADSTDKAVVLFDFCGWEHELRQEQQTISTTDDVQSVHSEEMLDENQISGNGEKKNDKQVVEIDTHQVPASSEGSYRMQRRGENHLKAESPFENTQHPDDAPMFGGSLDRNLMASAQNSDLERNVGDAVDYVSDCTNQDALYCVSGNTFQELDDATLVSKQSSTYREPGVNLKNTVAKDPEYGKETFQYQSRCSSEEYERFRSVYHNVSKLAADSILTPQRVRFAIVTNEEVTLRAGISTQGRPWLLIYLIHDFDRLPYFFNGVLEVEDFLSDHSTPLVIELEGEGYNAASSALLNDTPSVILFIDRMSNSSEIQEKSKEALQALQALSYHYASLEDNGGENGTERTKAEEKGKRISDPEGKEKRISELDAKVSTVHIEEHTVTQMVESGGLLELLRKANLETGSLQQHADGRFVFQVLTESIDNNGEKDGNPNILLTKVAQLKLLEEKFRQSFASGADSLLLPIHNFDLQVQKQEYSLPAHTPGHHNDKDSSQDSMFSVKLSREAGEEEQHLEDSSLDSHFRNDELCGECLLDGKSDSTVEGLGLSQNSVPTQMNLEPTDVLGSDSGNDVFDVSVCQGDMMEKSCLGMDEDLSVKLSGTIGPLSTADVEGSQPLTSDRPGRHDGKSAILRRNAKMNLTDEEDHQQFLGDEDEELDRYWNGAGFFFIDGEDQMKETLTRSKATPALVIIDPQKQAHYIFPSDLALNSTSLLSFVDSLLCGELKRTVLSEQQPPPPRQPPRPPFVNRDFHEIHPVPRVSVDSFSKLVRGFRESDLNGNQFTLHRDGWEDSEENGGNLTESVWNKDVLVLFTTPWCGFCKRMELVVREVYHFFQLVKGLDIPPSTDIIKSDVQQNLNDPTSTIAGGSHIGEKPVWNKRNVVPSEPPILLQMDCTLNDCSDHLGEIFESATSMLTAMANSELQVPFFAHCCPEHYSYSTSGLTCQGPKEETYPAVVLFPARNKLSPVVYSGAPTVWGIYDFLKGHGTATNPAQEDEGDSVNEKLISNQRTACIRLENVSFDPGSSSTTIKIGSGPGRKVQQEPAMFLWQLKSRSMDFGRHTNVGFVLLASEKLSGASPPFENSIVLIVSTAPGQMVHGLIVNKPMAWSTIQGLDGRLEELLSHAALGYGGPVVENHRPLLVLTHLHLEEFAEVVPGMYYGFVVSKGNLLEMIHTGRLAAKDFWFFFGYSSWTWDQLQSELAQELWQLRAFSNDLVKTPLQWSS